jgi:hypothetical protein
MKMEVVAKIYFNPQSLKEVKEAIEYDKRYREDGCYNVELIPQSDLISLEILEELENEDYMLYGNIQKGYKFKR